MENNYYIPAIEDIRLGYEAEALLPSKDSWVCDTWTPFVIDPMKYSHYTPWQGDGTHFDDVVNKLSLKQIRTPYLTKEQIESEGWKYKDVYRDGGSTSYEKGPYTLMFSGTNRMRPSTKIIIERTDSILGEYASELSTKHYRRVCVFAGDCPSINEFRSICKLIGI